MSLDLAIIAPWASLLLALIAILTQTKTWLSSGEKQLEARMVKAESKLVEYDRRIQALEAEIKHLPDRDTTHRLELYLSDITGRLNTIEERMSGRFSQMEEKLAPIQAMGERLNEVLLEQAKK